MTLLSGPVLTLALAEEPAAVDADFLEFLGSLDSDDEAWAALLTGAEMRRTGKSKPDDPPKHADPETQPKQVDP